MKQIKTQFITGMIAVLLVLSHFIVSAQTQTFNFTGGIQTFTVPCGVDTLFLQAWGAQGGSGATGGNAVAGGVGGLGGYAEGFLLVNPGDVLNVFVGGQGTTPAGGFNGGANGGSENAGGGGGASDVRVGGTAEANRVLVAGGGGGGGRGGCHEGSATGGIGGTGGFGGGGVGVNGGDSPQSNGVAGGGVGGNAGSVQGASGAAGIGCAGFLGGPGAIATTGTGGTGGAGQTCCCSSSNSIVGGGGGGGGFLGGGGGGGGSAGTTGCSGNSKGAGGGGGGGSSYVGTLLSGVTNNGIWLGNGQVSISYNLPNVADAGTITGTTDLCFGQSTTTVLTVPVIDQATDYNWVFPQGVNVPNGSNSNTVSFDFSQMSVGSYTVGVFGSEPCGDTGDTSFITINVNALPIADAGQDQSICEGDGATFTAIGGNTYSWSNNETGASISVNPSSTTTYSVTVTDVLGCTNTDDVTLTVNLLPTADAGNNTAVCEGESIILTASGGVSYEWSNGETTESIEVSPTETTNYNVTVTDANACFSTDFVEVAFNALPTVTFTVPNAIDTLCANGTAITLSGGTPAGGDYTGTAVSSNNFDPANATIGDNTVTYTYTDGNGCSNTASASIIVDVCSSVENISAEKLAAIYPNPNKGKFTVELQSTTLAVPSALQVYNTQGKMVYENKNLKRKNTVDITSMPQGVYYVKVQTNTGASTYSILIQK